MNISTVALPQNPADFYRFNKTATAYPNPDTVDAEAIAAFQRDGFIAVENVLTPDEIDSARAALTDLMAGKVPGFEGLMAEPEYRDEWKSLGFAERAKLTRKVWQFCEHEERLRELALAHPVISRLLTQLLGEPARLVQDMALLKPAHIGTEKPWHQDAAYFNWSPPEKIIGVWIALDPATAENGCMHAVPGTHLAGAVAHVHNRDCQIPDDAVEIERDVMVPLAPGGAMLFSALVHHGTPPNNSPQSRWALQYHYAAESCVPLSAREHGAIYFSDENYAGCRTGEPKRLDELDTKPVTNPMAVPVGLGQA